MSEESLEIYHLPIPAHYLGDIQKMLRLNEVFCSPSEDADFYDVLTHRREAAHHGTKIHTLVDRNVLSDVLSLARPAAQGVIVPCDERGRFGAALMVFLQCSNIVIEPSVALYENPATAQDDLALFRRADNVATEAYLKLALGLIDCLPPNELPPLNKPLPNADFNMRLKGRQKFRIAMSKIAELDLGNLSPLEKMESFLRWSHQEFCFLPAPMLLAALHFTPHRQLTILRTLKSPDRKKVLASIQNAVWDVHIIFEWTRRVKEQRQAKTFWLLCSRDAALKRIARIFYADDDLGAAEESLRRTLIQYWGKKDGTKIHDLMLDVQRRATEPTRSVNQSKPPGYLSAMEQKLEGAIINWKPVQH
jgi:hypothetical protein